MSNGAYLGTAACLAVGIPTGGIGTVACLIVGGAALGWGGGKLGNWVGDQIGTTKSAQLYLGLLGMTNFIATLGLAAILTSYVCFIILFYVAQKKLLIIETHLDKCTWVTDTARVWGNSGMLGKMHRLGMIYSIFIFPNFLHKRKAIDLEQAMSLPKELRLWVQVPFTTMNTAWIIMGFAWTATKIQA